MFVHVVDICIYIVTSENSHIAINNCIYIQSAMYVMALYFRGWTTYEGREGCPTRSVHNQNWNVASLNPISDKIFQIYPNLKEKK